MTLRLEARASLRAKVETPLVPRNLLIDASVQSWGGATLDKNSLADGGPLESRPSSCTSTRYDGGLNPVKIIWEFSNQVLVKDNVSGQETVFIGGEPRPASRSSIHKFRISDRSNTVIY